MALVTCGLKSASHEVCEEKRGELDPFATMCCVPPRLSAALKPRTACTGHAQSILVMHMQAQGMRQLVVQSTASSSMWPSRVAEYHSHRTSGSHVALTQVTCSEHALLACTPADSNGLPNSLMPGSFQRSLWLVLGACQKFFVRTREAWGTGRPRTARTARSSARHEALIGACQVFLSRTRAAWGRPRMASTAQKSANPEA